MSKRRTIKVDYLTRVEGEAALHVTVDGNTVSAVKLKIFEPPRFFEALLRGRNYAEAPDITARICGICPVAYQMSAVHAMEDAFGVKVSGPLRALRRLLYCGEWIESHALHIFLLHAPDFLGYDDAMQMAKDHPEIVERGLRLKKTGNQIMTLLGGREIHPINVRVGGFYKVPEKRDLHGLREMLKRGRDEALETVRWTGTLNFPNFEHDYEFVALRHAEEYPFNEGRVVSNRGLDIATNEYPEHFAEEHVRHSTALRSALKDRGSYAVGPLARFNLNFDKLSPVAGDAARSVGLAEGCRNPFQGIVVRAVEVLYAFDEAIRIIDAYEEPERPAVEIQPHRSIGHACTEAPRGLLYHRYEMDEEGMIRDATIVPPTSQNQATIEEDLRRLVPQHLALPHAELTRKCEQAVRNYDPCISCSAHFLKLEVERK